MYYATACGGEGHALPRGTRNSPIRGSFDAPWSTTPLAATKRNPFGILAVQALRQSSPLRHWILTPLLPWPFPNITHCPIYAPLSFLHLLLPTVSPSLPHAISHIIRYTTVIPFAPPPPPPPLPLLALPSTWSRTIPPSPPCHTRMALTPTHRE